MTKVCLAKRTTIMATMALLIFGAAACTREKPPSSEPTPSFGGAITPMPGTGVAIATVPFMFTESAAPPTESAESPVDPLATVTPLVPFGTTTSYTIQAGDWLSKIAQRYGVTSQALMAANPGLDPNKIRAGQVIVIPAAGAPVPTVSTPTLAPIGASTPAPSSTPGPMPSGSFTYTVQRDDGLYSIARKFGVTLQALQNANPIVLQKAIYPGQVLIIPGGNSNGQPTPNGGGGTTYTVRAGDTLYSIAVRFGKSVSEIQTANHLASVDSIYAGQTLVIP